MGKRMEVVFSPNGKEENGYSFYLLLMLFQQPNEGGSLNVFQNLYVGKPFV